MRKVAVLMSTYNGEKYLREQIDSILNQIDVDISLYIRDDGSSDGTIAILEEYRKKNNNFFFYVGPNKRSCGSFLELLNREYQEDFFAFADQDDVWKHDKLISAISQIEVADDACLVPVMYHSNLDIVDENLLFYRLSHPKPLITKYKYQPFIENLSTGCTVVFNKKAYELARKYRVDSYSMHDAYMFTLCSVFGKVVYDFSSHIKYRQHSNNVVGTNLRYGVFSFLKMCIVRFIRVFNRNLQPSFTNMNVLWRSCGKDMPDGYREMCELVVNYKKSFLNRMKLFFCKQYRPNRWQKNWTARLLILLGIV